ncbi:DUF982 domain-containing protein [Rhizobium cauense]|uniref:DUF982 domain-containing protein n=1 Tax=Rhizobium cauense TaxID=1166683 RepID=UPI001C6EBC04|nr:DUF982 domain-containing protein [Rhizobium cauense]MBW9117724.1 DUF982 domain-containing protein [Rhizobium cauense]
MDVDLPVIISPLDVEIDGIGKYRHADTVRDLVGMMIGGKWPEGGRQFHNSLWMSMEAIEWYVDAETARRAFVDAADEVGMHVFAEMKKAT